MNPSNREPVSFFYRHLTCYHRSRRLSSPSPSGSSSSSTHRREVFPESTESTYNGHSETSNSINSLFWTLFFYLGVLLVLFSYYSKNTADYIYYLNSGTLDFIEYFHLVKKKFKILFYISYWRLMTSKRIWGNFDYKLKTNLKIFNFEFRS